MKEPIQILEEIKADYLEKFENDPAIRRICTTMIEEYKIRSGNKDILQAAHEIFYPKKTL